MIFRKKTKTHIVMKTESVSSKAENALGMRGRWMREGASRGQVNGVVLVIQAITEEACNGAACGDGKDEQIG